MRSPSFGHSFAVIVAPILLSVLAFNFLNKKKTSVHKNASSVSAAPIGQHYEVFLSFRGPDIRRGFTDHLYNGLLNAGIDAFRDDDELRQGEEISPDPLAAIKNSKILIPILSVNYGSSSRCLDQLVQIMECKRDNMGRIVLPIFYKVKPADVRHQIGHFGDAFHQRERRLLERGFDPTILEKWKQALREVSSLKAWEADGYEAQLVKSVVQEVLRELKKEFELVIPENLVGIDSHVEKVMKFVDDRSGATLFVGIHGMGGIGKTALAKTIYNKLSDQFEHRSFIADVSESCKCNGLVYLQNQLIYDILMHKSEVYNEDEGIAFLSSKFKGKKVLILLDDVDDVDQLKALAGNHKWFSSGSRIIITTRNRTILDNAEVDCIYEHKLMDKDQSMVLNKKKTSVHKNAFSLSAAPIGQQYEVFLSFRGHDTRHGFTDHLYNGLLNAGIDAFRDDYELRQGEEISPEFWAAIKNSKILIPILSVNYGSSSWCLDQLVQIMECKRDNMGRIVLPIFYKVKPADVGYQIGSFGDAFHERERRLLERGFDPTILEKWKQALREVSCLKGWEADGYEAQLVKSVVQEVLRELKKEFELVIPENLVGIDSHVEKVMKFVDDRSGATLFVGIHGMGGIGKTALAKTIYNKLSDQFEHRSFIADVSESCKCNGLMYLQNQLIYDILMHKSEVYNEDEGIAFLSSKFKGKKVLILLDDVDDVDQLKALAGNHKWFPSGSRIIITTRNRTILDNAEVDCIYEHKLMDKDQSMVLFCRHAFRRNFPPSDFEDLTCDVVSTTEGLPLSLVILGSFLCGKEPKYWTDTIKKLRNVPPKEVLEKLRVSYEPLEYEQKQIFLDIACFFSGTDGRIASYMWNACGFFPEEGIEVLRLMSLIKVGDNHELRMSDQLRDLGREIVHGENLRDPQYRSRLWDSKEIQKVLKGNKGTEKIQAIYLSKGSTEGSDETADQGGEILTNEQFKNLTSLRFLHVDGAHFRGDFKNSIQDLRWLRWRNCPLTFEAKNFYIKKLIVLDLSRSKISNEWQGWSSIMMAENLKFLDLTLCGSLDGTFFLSAFKNLEVLILKCCWRLKQIDSSIGDMKALVRLDLSDCWSLKKLPEEVGKLEALEELLLKDSRGISVIPDSIGDLRNLEILNISGTGIIELPIGIGRLRKLRNLDASSSRISVVPESIRNLSSLQRLDFDGCENLLSLPEFPSNLTYLSVTCQSPRLPSLSHLSHLKELRVIDCKFLECIWELPSTQLELSECSQVTDVEESELPKSLNTPFKLEILEIRGCHFMETLDVSQFNRLRTLFADYCTKILEVRGLDKLKYLASLIIRRCATIERLNLSKSKGLKLLDAGNCEKLFEIQDLDRLEYLEKLDISWCTSIERLDLPKSKNLKILDARHCKNLVEIQGLDRLEFLENLDISSCASIERLDLQKSKRLKILEARNCNNLVEIQGLDRLEFLEVLNISGCASIEMLDLTKSEGLKILDAGNCENLVEIQGLDILELLEVLNISGCASIERLYLPKSNGLKMLEAGNCENLVEIQGLDRLELLEVLNISGCVLIEMLDVRKSQGLKKLDAGNCENLFKIQGLDRLELLKELNISWCASIERLDLPKSDYLKMLDARNCENLVEIQGLDWLKFLEELDISWCTLIESLNLSKSKGLKKLYATHCENLVEIQGLDRLEFLEELYISGHASIVRLTLPKSEALKILDTKNCENLVEILGLDTLKFMEELNISGCASIERLDLSNSEGLEILDAENCENLLEIEGLDRLELLKELNISGCASLKRLDLPESKCLKVSNARYCKNLVEIQGLDRLEFLEELNISGCTSIKRLNLPKLQNLKILAAGNCKNLTEVEGLDRLEFLEKLNISRCTLIERLDLSKSGGLKILDTESCENLVEFQGLERLKLLEVLNIFGCTSIERLYLPKSEGMKKLDVGNCKNLVEIQGLDRLEFLEELNISGCTSIERLYLPKSEGMKKLDVGNCKNLVEIQGLDRLEFLEELNISGCTSIKRLNPPKLEHLKILGASNCENLVEIEGLISWSS